MSWKKAELRQEACGWECWSTGAGVGLGLQIGDLWAKTWWPEEGQGQTSHRGMWGSLEVTLHGWKGVS